MNAEHRTELQRLLCRLARDRQLPSNLRPHVQQLSQMNWSADLAALAQLWRLRPEWAEEFLDAMVCELHEFPELQLMLGALPGSDATAGHEVGQHSLAGA